MTTNVRDGGAGRPVEGLSSETAPEGAHAQPGASYDHARDAAVVDGVPYCAPCGSYHATPRDAAHHAGLMCRAPWPPAAPPAHFQPTDAFPLPPRAEPTPDMRSMMIRWGRLVCSVRDRHDGEVAELLELARDAGMTLDDVLAALGDA